MSYYFFYFQLFVTFVGPLHVEVTPPRSAFPARDMSYPLTHSARDPSLVALSATRSSPHLRERARGSSIPDEQSSVDALPTHLRALSPRQPETWTISTTSPRSPLPENIHSARLLTDNACRFGNFIGEEVASEEASDAGGDAGDYVYDDENDGRQDSPGDELMELDGPPPLTPAASLLP